MKRILLFIKTVETEIAAALTPEKKKEILETAKTLAPHVLNGTWLELALVAITALEATIATA